MKIGKIGRSLVSCRDSIVRSYGNTMAGQSEMSSGQYLHAARDLRLESRPLPPPAADEVQVAIKSTALCGSDVHYYREYRNGTILVREPLCLGHESAGEIVAVGANVAAGAAKINPRLRPGLAVALEVGVPCDRCDCGFCAGGRYNICPNLRFRSSGSKFPHYQGTLQERVNHPARWVYELPENLGFEVGALLEPLAVAIHAVRRSELVSGGSYSSTTAALVFGAGPVGLLCAVAAQAAGFRHIAMCDIDQGRLGFAESEGFASVTYLVKPKKCDSLEEKLAVAKEVAADIAALKLPDGSTFGQAATTFECTGIESSIQAAIYVSRLVVVFCSCLHPTKGRSN